MIYFPAKKKSSLPGKDPYENGCWRLLALKKETSYDQRGVFSRPTILLCYGDHPPIFDMLGFLDGSPSWADLTDSKFTEIWLMDLSDEYYSAQDPRKPADLYCLSPADLRGFYELPRTRKPYG